MRYAAVVAGVVLLSLLVWTVTAYAGAAGEARLLASQLEEAKAEVTAALLSREEATARTDSLGAYADSVQERSDSLVANARVQATAARTVNVEAFAEALILTDSLPRLRNVILRLQASIEAERRAWNQERTAILDASEALRNQLGAFALERVAWNQETESLREALDLSESESAAWQRAASPSIVKQIWRQGRVAVLVGALVFVVAR